MIKKFENIKDLLDKQKDYSGKLNECIKMSLANIIATKTNYKNELIKVQDNIRYDLINNTNTESQNNQNLINGLNNINTAITEFKNKVDTAENIYLNANVNNINNNTNNNINQDSDINMNTIEFSTNNSSNDFKCTKGNRLEKLFSQVNGGFRF